MSRVLQGCLEKLVEVKKLCELPDGPYMYGELTEAESEQLERLAACKDLKEQAAKVPAVTFGRLSSKKMRAWIQPNGSWRNPSVIA